MELERLLTSKKPLILKRWFDLAVETYPRDTSKFIKRQKDRFANPVGRTTHQTLKAALDLLLDEFDTDKAALVLDPMIRIRAIQDFSPSRATGIVFGLKKIVRDIVDRERERGGSGNITEGLLAFESKIDKLGLVAFDIYLACREKIYELKANEVRNRSYRAFERAGLISGMSAVENDRNGTKPHQ
jgi:hypothetical protein